ncbi:spore wall protein 2-like [Benincasa hispida]|uniref:spore wall protein 2-like n=1 Tax=Benincasa hispida TaxID=102211 RepID=UPI001901A950|nr:spore wall protein 2-like [Benincasa hispida]
MKLQVLAILSIFLLSLEVDGRKSLLQKEDREEDAKLAKQSTILDADFHGKMVASNHQMKKFPTDLEDAGNQEDESSEGDEGLEEGIPEGDEGEYGRGTPEGESGEVPEDTSNNGGDSEETEPGDDQGESKGDDGDGDGDRDDEGESREGDLGDYGGDFGGMVHEDNQRESRGDHGDRDIVGDDVDKRG